MKEKVFVVLLSLTLAAAPVFANGENGDRPTRNRNTNVNLNLNKNRNKNYNTNRNYNTNVNLNKQHQHQSQYQGQGQHQGQVGIVKDGDVTVKGDITNVKSYADAPSINPPALTSGNDVCMGSASVSATGGSGVFGIGLGFGKTYTDENCVRLKNVNALFRMGLVDAALALLANNPEVADALRATGTPFATYREAAIPVLAAPSATHHKSVSDWGIDFENTSD